MLSWHFVQSSSCSRSPEGLKPFIPRLESPYPSRSLDPSHHHLITITIQQTTIFSLTILFSSSTFLFCTRLTALRKQIVALSHQRCLLLVQVIALVDPDPLRFSSAFKHNPPSFNFQQPALFPNPSTSLLRWPKLPVETNHHRKHHLFCISKPIEVFPGSFLASKSCCLSCDGAC